MGHYQRLLVTGGAGFIGSAVCRHFVGLGIQVCNVDKLTYAANPASLASVADQENYRFEKVDICDRKLLEEVVLDFSPDAIMHLAAESHVDRSIDEPMAFIDTNVVGTVNLLEAAMALWSSKGKAETFRFHHVSTDEVYGDLPLDGGVFTEETAYAPSSPYSASKAASDFMVSAWHRTYGLPAIISNCSNNFGPFQNQEKLIPTIVSNAVAGKPIPVYGDGLNVRDWLYVDDHVSALQRVLTAGRIGENYNVGGNSEWRNIDLVHAICAILNQKLPREDGESYATQITFVKDRAGHDLRYAIDPTKIRSELNWTPVHTFEQGLSKTIDWYLDNTEFVSLVTA